MSSNSPVYAGLFDGIGGECVDCVTAGNIMVQLFLQTNPKYQLTNKKLQYLLCIAQIISVSTGRPLFPEMFRNLKNDFVLEPVADTFTYSKAIQEGRETNRSLDLSYDDFTIPYSCKRIYEVKEQVSDEDKRILIDTFVQFGGYKEKALCKELDELTPLRQLPIWSYISNETISEFLDTALKDTAEPAPGRILSLCKNNRTQEIRLPKPQDNPKETPVDNERITPFILEAIEKAAAAVASAPVSPPVNRNVLQGCASYHLTRLVVDKKYSLYIETPSNAAKPVVTIVSTNDNSVLQGTLVRVSNTVYCYTFFGVVSDIKIRVDI